MHAHCCAPQRYSLGAAQPSCNRVPPLKPFFQPETQVCSADKQPLGRRPTHTQPLRFALYLCHAPTPAISTPGHAATPWLPLPFLTLLPVFFSAHTFISAILFHVHQSCGLPHPVSPPLPTLLYTDSPPPPAPHSACSTCSCSFCVVTHGDELWGVQWHGLPSFLSRIVCVAAAGRALCRAHGA